MGKIILTRKIYGEKEYNELKEKRKRIARAAIAVVNSLLDDDKKGFVAFGTMPDKTKKMSVVIENIDTTVGIAYMNILANDHYTVMVPYVQDDDIQHLYFQSSYEE